MAGLFRIDSYVQGNAYLKRNDGSSLALPTAWLPNRAEGGRSLGEHRSDCGRLVDTARAVRARQARRSSRLIGVMLEQQIMLCPLQP